MRHVHGATALGILRTYSNQFGFFCDQFEVHGREQTPVGDGWTQMTRFRSIKDRSQIGSTNSVHVKQLSELVVLAVILDYPESFAESHSKSLSLLGARLRHTT